MHTFLKISKKYKIYSINVWMLLLLLSLFSRVELFPTPETAAHQAAWFLGFSRQEHWSGLPLKVKVKSLSPVWLLVTSWTAAYQAPPSMGFTRPECLNTYVQLTLEYMLENTILPPRIVWCISGATFLHLIIRIKLVA